MRLLCQCIMGVWTLALVAACSADLQAPTAPKTDAYDHVGSGGYLYLASLYFDACGESALAEIYRRAIWEMLEQCPFSASAKEEFRGQTARDFGPMIEATRRENARKDGTPCESMRKDRRFLELQDRVARQQRGEIGLAQILEARTCEQMAVDPLKTDSSTLSR